MTHLLKKSTEDAGGLYITDRLCEALRSKFVVKNE